MTRTASNASPFHPASHGDIALEEVKVELLNAIGSATFFDNLRDLVLQLTLKELVGYRVSGSNHAVTTYSWKSCCGCFQPQGSPAPANAQLSEGLILETEKTEPSIEQKQRDAVFIKAIKFHHLVMEYKEQKLAQTLLTKREGEILKLIQKCRNNREISSDLGISPRTVEKHCQNMFEKLQVENRNALIHLVAAHEL